MKTQAEEAYNELRRRILILEIRPEERLKEEYWAQRLQVSRPAIRETLTRLHGEGLLVKGAKGGYFVAPMTPQDVRDIRQVREIIEVAALELAAERIPKEELDLLEETCDDFGEMVRKGYHTGACEADRRFHDLLVAASGNNKLIRAYHFSHVPLFHLRLGQSREYIDDYADTESEHRKIVANLREKNVSAAIETLRAHFRRGEKAVLNHL